MIVGKDVRVVDFGIARHLAGQANGGLDVTGKGTPSYMAPERLLGRPSDPRADVFSFCVALWEALYGVKPYAGSTRQELLDAIEAGRLASGTKLPGTPDAIRPILSTGLSADIDERPEMMPLLRALTDAAEFEKQKVAWWRRVARGAGFVLLGAAVVLLAFALQRSQVEPVDTQREPVALAIEPASPEVNEVAQTLARAEKAARRGHCDVAVQSLELARSLARQDGDMEALRQVAIEAEQIGHVLKVHGDLVEAVASWGVARDNFIDLGDKDSIERLDRLLDDAKR